MRTPARTVQPIHFEDFSGTEFERLVFAYHARAEKWLQLEWYGQVGSDLGRDIWGVRDNGTPGGETVCIQCANRKQLTFAKAEDDIAKVLTAVNGIPACFRLVTRAKVSADMRDKIKQYAQTQGIRTCEVWSGTEFEEFLRQRTESLLKRFTEGEVFPDAAAELLTFAQADSALTDAEAIALLARLFDRPAFYTPIQEEGNLRDFKQAITDTIQALGTGIYKARDGGVIARMPSRHQLKDATLRDNVQAVEIALAKLRSRFDGLVKSGVVRPCSCGKPDCPIYFMPRHAAQELETLRGDALRAFEVASPGFRPRSW